ncbi:MAG: hypothetical protein KGP08_08280 [Xanthomonadaceae bacterium]|nr:hypothetical protein [Xanthomonadaceae bacterium]MDE1961279.1 hypothetical protein [Xanthomonadaceae bacterium]MDE2258598.1 hypothetical protein [Xanthomonadaceae bacterium]
MANEKYLAVIGLSEEDTAHLRLLLRKVAGELEQNWRWGTEDNADLVIVGPAELAGQIARNRAFSGGRRCAVFDNGEPLRDGELRLHKPLKAESVIAMLNGTGAPGEGLGQPVMRANADFYADDTLNPEFRIEEENAAAEGAQRRDAEPALGLDDLFKPDSEAAKPQFAVPLKLDAETRIEKGNRVVSARSDRRIADSVRGIRGSDLKPEGINIAADDQADTAAVSGKHPLRDYLRKNLLGGPARAALEGAPELVLDPKAGCFHAGGGLAALAPYCNVDLARSAWRPVTTQDLTRLRTQQPARPYAHLLWIDAFAHAGGRLARHLDPGGRFRLKGAALTDADVPHHARIVAALAAPAKLNEIAAASGAPMAAVFDLVSAYDAIGRIEVEGRLSRHAAAPKSGLFARLRNPFSRS